MKDKIKTSILIDRRLWEEFKSRVGSLFKCLSCRYSCNADYNGAMNILKRGMGYMSMLGAPLAAPITRYDEAIKAEEPGIPLLK